MSNFIVSARKYRPQRFEDVVGQQHVAGTLKNALATDHVAHAFLFTGPRGVGKTTCARILAKILNCENRTPQFEACNTCSSCTSFNENASFNIIELDAASNNSVEHIRALIEQVRFQPQQGRYKVFIIDEVHMLSNQAFNAFLKTLEEPPPYAIFILATTEKHKIIPTILSRCQIFDFRRITVADMVSHLRAICAKEGLEAEEDALHIIGQKADGALRDALSIFDRITSSSAGRKITYNDVIENLNVLDYDYYFQVTDALLSENAPVLLNIFDQILRKGFEADLFINGLAEHLRNILVCKNEATLALLEVGEGLRDRYRKQAGLAPSAFLLTALSIANDCDFNFKMARNKRLHVEIALLKMCYIGRTIEAAQLGNALFANEKKTPDSGISPTGAPNMASNGNARPLSNGKNEELSPSNGFQPSQPAKEEMPPNGSGSQQTMASSPNNGSNNTATGNAHELDPNEMADLRTSMRLGLKKAEPISLRLDAYDEAVAVDEARNADLSSRLNLENATAEWRNYASQLESNLVRLSMLNSDLALQGSTLTATVRGTIDRSNIQAEANRLLDFLRNRLHDNSVLLQVVLDDTKAQEMLASVRSNRPLSDLEKIERMKNQNPLIADLITRFDLKKDG